ncbi:hypothetical protein PLICBS_003608 [Purpureocillium lilacinum]|uniref:uncharacterized protein n=1 Tax=Purpureocillium lilacinum TaxID=33203 RepID=UPI00208D6B9C|nr:hypothetical protein PLICBS_003608 [Purpureocillium lilacinum]
MSSQITYLPTEIRLGIVEALLEDGCRLAPLATVSRDWQEVVEPYTFSHIKLTTERAGQFASMTRRNRAHIRYIWVSLEIRDYDCLPCLKDRGWGVRQAMNEANRVLVASALRDLFAALSEWEPTGSLVLDFGVDSPCDPKEWFKYRASGLDESDDEDDEGRCPEEGWTPQFYGPHPRIPYRLNVFEHIMQGSFFGRDPLKEQICWHLLPQAPAVTGVLLREQGSIQCRPTALRCLLSRFPRLEEIYCEPRTLWYSKTSARGLGGSISCFEALASSGVRRLVLMENDEDSDDSSSDSDSDDDDGAYGLVLTPGSEIGRQVASASLNLEHLSVAFNADARAFFRACQPDWTWPNLTSLALTSYSLASGQQGWNNGLLRAAAATAMRMPRLETMEIWNPGLGRPMLFRYEAKGDGRRPVIRWRGKWTLELDPETVRAWEAVALEHRGRACVVVGELLDEGTVIKCLAESIGHLKLSSEVVRSGMVRELQRD